MTATTARTYTSNVVVRWSDMDAFKHVNHARMVALLEEARIDSIERLEVRGPYPGQPADLM